MIDLGGPAARKGAAVDILFIIPYLLVDFEEANQHKIFITFPNVYNKL